MAALKVMPKLQFLCLNRAVSRTGDYLQMLSPIGRGHVVLKDLIAMDIHEDLAFVHEVLRCIRAHPGCMARVQVIDHDQPAVQIPYVAELNTIGKYVLDWLERAGMRGSVASVHLKIGQGLALAVQQPTQGGFWLMLPQVEEAKRWVKNGRWERAFVAVLEHLRRVHARSMSLEIDMDQLKKRVDDVGTVFSDTLGFLQYHDQPGQLVFSVHSDAVLVRHVRPGAPVHGGDVLINFRVTRGAAWNDTLRIVQIAFEKMQPYPFVAIAMDVSLGIGDAFHARMARKYGNCARELILKPGRGMACVITQLTPDAQTGVPFPMLHKLTVVGVDLDEPYYEDRNLFDHLLNILALRYAASHWRALPVLKLEDCRGVSHPRYMEFTKVAVRIEVANAGA